MNPTSGLEYAEYHPVGALAARVRCIWALRVPAEPNAVFEPIFPDGCMELVFNLADQFERAEGNRVVRQERTLLVGQLLGPVRVRPTGATDIIGIRFQPWGLRRVGTVDPNELFGQTVCGDALAPSLPTSVATALGEIENLDERCAFLSRILAAGLLPDLRETPPAALVALALGKLRSVSKAAREAGISPRHLERLSDQWIGLPPYELIRLARFQRALHRLRHRTRHSLSQIALESGFSDQAHFTRDFGRFAGVTPAAFRASISNFTATFITNPEGDAPAPDLAD